VSPAGAGSAKVVAPGSNAAPTPTHSDSDAAAAELKQWGTPGLPVISATGVTEVSSQHSDDVVKCLGTAEPHGDVSIRFEISAAGKVVNDALTSTINNPKLASCIEAALRSWQFPAPEGAAKGLYSVSFQ
jgi:hypothetical protein